MEEALLLALVLVEPLIFTPFTRNPFIAKDLLFSVALMILATVRFAALKRGPTLFRLPFPPAAALAGVIGVYAALTLLSPMPTLSLACTIRLAGYAALFLLVASRAWDLRFFRRFFTAILVGTIVAASYGLLQAAHLDPVSWADTFRIAGAPPSTLRIFSTFGHPNFFGSHLAMALFFMGALALLGERLLPRTVAAAGIVLGVSCLLLTLNRGAWVGFLAAAGLVAALTWVAWRSGSKEGSLRREVAAGGVTTARVLAAIAGLVLLAGLAASVGSPQVRRRLAVSFDEPTIKSRLLIWEGAVKMIRERPLAGFGPGTFGRNFPFYRDERLATFHDELTPVTHAHNEYLEIAAETGMIGTAAMLLFLAVVLNRGFRKLRAAPSREEWITTTAVLAGATSILAGNLFGVELRYVNASLFLWLLLGFLAAETPRAEVKPAAPGSRRASFAIAAALCLGAAVVLLLSLRVFVGEIHLQRAEEFLSSGATELAAQEGKTAAAWNRTEPGGLMLAGEALTRGKDYAGAQEVYREVERVNPGEPLIGYNLALTAYLRGDYDEGLAKIAAARRLYPRHAPTRSLHYDLWLKKGMGLVGRGDLEGAKAAFRSATRHRLDRLDPRPLFYLGNVAALERDYAAAAERYRKALALDPDFRPAAENLKKVEPLLAR